MGIKSFFHIIMRTADSKVLDFVKVCLFVPNKITIIKDGKKKKKLTADGGLSI